MLVFSSCNICKPIVGFRNDKSLKDYIVRAALPKMDNAGGSEPCGKDTYQVCDHITTNTFTTKPCEKVSKIQCGLLNYNSKKAFYLLRCKICDDKAMLKKLKQSFVFGEIIMKVNTYLFE